MEEILTRHGEAKELARLTGKCERTVRNALKGRKNNELAARIRNLAILRGGKEASNVVITNKNK